MLTVGLWAVIEVITIGRSSIESIIRVMMLIFLKVFHLCRVSLRIVYLKLTYSESASVLRRENSSLYKLKEASKVSWWLHAMF